ncbi:root meristem growth factor 8, GOLVEN 6 [Hibiscus trionum]|uniref:Root meristem growth factor 8, GOLVEN 6 n=1 Tax=Hibiscus trionum TaxID=183268 RepID=A0A9W7LSQ8_HIBTR|nr:root meristem growth factor 8, GOLVEN 6 [Hibiscus trionum]
MELKGIFITVLCFSFFALQTPCTSLQIQLQSSNEQAKRVQISPHTLLLPRKLRFTEEHAFKGHVAVVQHSISSTKKKEDASGKARQKEQGRRQERGEGDYFTMDYSHVRRRRPIHNKSLPLGP